VDENGEPRSVKAALDLLRKADKDGHLTARKRLAKTALDRLDRIRVLCTHRRGPRGVETMNRLVRDWLRGAMPGAGDWFEGQPILVLQNDYHVRLFNGDVGIVLRDPFAITPAEGDRLVAVFPDSGSPDGVRAVPQGRLPPYETVFAMTIHKSQGSQFDRVVVLLPARDSDFVTRELLYTGITRARTHVTLAGDATVLRTCLARRVQRASGLRKRLWNEEPVDLPEASGSHC
jgi:exodeoxyribonuclease V alpha subunit